MSEFECRPARDSDLRALTELWWLMQSSHDPYSPRFYKNVGPDECKALCHRYFEDLMTKQDCMMHVATASETPIGMIVAHFRTRPPVYEVRQQIEVEIAVVHPAYRCSGIFRGLLACVEEKSKLAGVAMIELLVDHENPARLAYEKTGFVLRQDKMVKWL